MELAECARRARRVRDLYDELNRQARGCTRSREEFMLGDMGDLAKLVMAAQGARDVPGGRPALGHELADCPWSVLTLAERYDIDLTAEFDRTMTRLERDIGGELVAARS